MITVSKSDFDRRIIPDDTYMECLTSLDGMRLPDCGEYIGVRASVELPIPYGKDRILTRIESPGLWGIESDSGEDYLDSVFQEESAILADMLAELGVKVQ